MHQIRSSYKSSLKEILITIEGERKTFLLAFLCLNWSLLNVSIRFFEMRDIP